MGRIQVNKNNHNREVEKSAARWMGNSNMWSAWATQMILPEYRARIAHRWACIQLAIDRFYWWIGTPDFRKEQEKYRHPRRK